MLLLVCFQMAALAAGAQQTLRPLPQEKLQNKTYGRFLFPDSKEGWIKFREDAPYTAQDLFVQQPELFGLNSNDEMRLFKMRTDATGNHHYRFGQYYKGVRVERVEQLVHEREGRVYLTNGDLVNGLNLDVQPSIPEKQAIEAALSFVNASEYLFDDPAQEARFKQKKDDPTATLYPQPELLVVQKDLNSEMNPLNYVLAYRMFVFAKVPAGSYIVYVDAHTGAVLRKQDLGISCIGGTAATTFNGTQTVNTRFSLAGCGGSASFQSVDDCDAGSEIYSWDDGDGELRCDADNNWTQGSSYIKQMCISSLWAIRNVFNYYKTTWNHTSYDGNGGLMDIYNDHVFTSSNGNPTGKNAMFEPIIDNILVGSGATTANFSDDFNTDDILGHEFTHGVIYYAHIDPLLYMNESGALNESFADIFGEAAERFAEGSNDWLEAADKSDGPIRSFINPNSFGDPDTYYGVNWYDGGADNGGVHTNSSVQNHMFWLLATGGVETDDNGITTHVEGIGFDNAIAIAWEAMMNYLNSTNGYPTARNAWIAAAAALFGTCSQQMISTGAAWEAVGIYDPDTYLKASICGTFSSPLPINYTASDEIRNYSILFGNYIAPCSVTVNAAGNVSLKSGKAIRLFPDFIAKSGCTFVALIDECKLSNYDPDDTKLQDEPEQLQLITGNDPLLSLYPNPADGLTYVEFVWNNESPVDLYVMDVAGRVVLRVLNGSVLADPHYKTAINTAGFPNGLFLCVLKSANNTHMQKLMVEH